jgi:PTH1 family peptidyl-tRNA hydrolase
MNLSGQAVAGLARYYKVSPTHIVVIHDDVDLPFNTIRMRPGGGSAGQKGVGSIIERLGTQEFPRLRMGIGRPPGRMDAAGYVLQSFEKSEQQFLADFLDRAVDALDCFLIDGLETAMNRFNPAV